LLKAAFEAEDNLASTSLAHRGVVVAKGGAVASSQPLAVSAGIAALANGGNCIDAAIAASAVLCVVEPHNSHLGGDAFIVYYSAKDRETIAFNASGVAPKSATWDSYREGIPLHGVRAATVPGLVHCWGELHQRYASRSFTEALRPAIGYARDGYPVGPRVARVASAAGDLFSRNPFLQTLGLSTNTQIGDLVRQPELAWTLESIAREGVGTFYNGPVAERIVAGSQGHFTLDDLAAHRTRVLTPLRARYRDLIFHGQPPPSQGHILLQELQIVNGFDLTALDDVTRTHLLIEAKKLAFADRNAYLADPEWINVPVNALLSGEYASKRRAMIDLQQAMPEYPAGVPLTPVEQGSETTYFLTADREGNAISFIQSVYHGYGSAYVIPETGILLNNRLTGFVLDSQSPNVVAPGKRPAHTLNAWLATRPDGSLAYVGGTPGGHIQVQTNLQLAVNLVDGGDNPQIAIERPRWQHMTNEGAVSEPVGAGVVEIEERVGESVVSGLRSLGHEVLPIGEWAHGSSAQLLAQLPNGTYALGSDPRCDGLAAGI
jgi:gamma-glutamyltranspeptidase/glutathione hydrolase